MSHTDLRDFSPEYETSTDSGLFIQVEKLGGGTVGERYTGTWRYVVSNADGEEIASGQDFITALSHSHRWVARAIASDLTRED